MRYINSHFTYLLTYYCYFVLISTSLVLLELQSAPKSTFRISLSHYSVYHAIIVVVAAVAVDDDDDDSDSDAGTTNVLTLMEMTLSLQMNYHTSLHERQ